MTTRCNSLLLGVVSVLVITSVILGLFIGLLDSVKVVNEPIDGSFFPVEGRSKYSTSFLRNTMTNIKVYLVKHHDFFQSQH